jgi:putative transposase
MSRKPRIEFSGALYHVTTRGNDQRMIFMDDRDREVFLSHFAAIVHELRWRCHTYCLMGNHYHFLVEIDEPNLAAGMCRLNGAYARGFNRRHGRQGHLFERRYHPVLVESEPHFLECCRYVVLNPVRAGLCETPDEWKWSSYRSLAGIARPLRFLEMDWLLGQFGRDRSAARDRYVGFVAAGSPATSLEGLLAA